MEHPELTAATDLAKSLIANGQIGKDEVAAFVAQTRRVLEGRPEDRIDLEIMPRLAAIEQKLSSPAPVISNKAPEPVAEKPRDEVEPTPPDDMPSDDEIKNSISPDALLCLVCGEQYKTLKLHLSKSHGMTPVEYRRKFGLPNDYPMMAPRLSQERSEQTKKSRAKKVRKK